MHACACELCTPALCPACCWGLVHRLVCATLCHIPAMEHTLQHPPQASWGAAKMLLHSMQARRWQMLLLNLPKRMLCVPSSTVDPDKQASVIRFTIKSASQRMNPDRPVRCCCAKTPATQLPSFVNTLTSVNLQLQQSHAFADQVYHALKVTSTSVATTRLPPPGHANCWPSSSPRLSTVLYASQSACTGITGPSTATLNTQMEDLRWQARAVVVHQDTELL